MFLSGHACAKFRTQRPADHSSPLKTGLLLSVALSSVFAFGSPIAKCRRLNIVRLRKHPSAFLLFEPEASDLDLYAEHVEGRHAFDVALDRGLQGFCCVDGLRAEVEQHDDADVHAGLVVLRGDE